MNEWLLAVDARNSLGEGVRWCEATQQVYWTDIPGKTLWRHAPRTGAIEHWSMPERLAAFALTTEPGRLLLGLGSRLAFLTLDSGAISDICSVEPELPGTRVNDGRCDRQGRFVFGTMNEADGNAAIGSFYRLGADLHLEKLPLPPVGIANSVCFSPDGCRLYYCDSPTKKIRVCDYEPVTGAISTDRLFADLSNEPGEPDGSTIDSEGCLWNAQWGGARLVRYSEDGQVLRVIPVPAHQPSCIAFGGENFDQLYVTSARVGLNQVHLDATLMQGGLLSCDAFGAKGIPEVRFAG